MESRAERTIELPRGGPGSDAELASAFRRGDREALAALYDRYKRPLYLFARRMLGEPEAAIDLVQEVFLRLHERRGQLDRPECFRSWLFAAARHRCLTELRRSRRWEPIEAAATEKLLVLPTADPREEEEELERLRRALGSLRIEFREVLILREYQELSYREIAEITESSESAVKSRLFKARQALHAAYAPRDEGKESGREL